MPKKIEDFNEDLYGFLKANGFTSIEPKDIAGDTVEPEAADQFTFDYTADGVDYGKVSIITNNGEVIVAYNQKLIQDAGGGSKWTKFLGKLKDWSLRHGQMKFKPIDNDSKRDELMKKRKEAREAKLLEGYHGTKYTSYGDPSAGNIRLIIKHSQAIGEGDLRYTHIDKIFLETSAGERLLLNTRKPSVGRAFARHLAEGGEYNDDRWKHISEISTDINKLGGFVRATKNAIFNESAAAVVTEVGEHYNRLRETIKRLQGKRGYQNYFENWAPAIMEDGPDFDYSGMFTTAKLDPRIEAALPILGKLKIGTPEIAEANEFENWANGILDEDAIQTSKVDDLADLLNSQAELPLGPGAINVASQLKKSIDSSSELDSLLSELEDIAAEDPNYDAKPAIIAFLQKNSDNQGYSQVLDKLKTPGVPAEKQPPPAKPAEPAKSTPASPAPAPGGTSSPSQADVAAADKIIGGLTEEGTVEGKSKPVQRNFVAKHAQRSGAGKHGKPGYQRHDKHKKKLGEEYVSEKFDRQYGVPLDQQSAQAFQQIPINQRMDRIKAAKAAGYTFNNKTGFFTPPSATNTRQPRAPARAEPAAQSARAAAAPAPAAPAPAAPAPAAPASVAPTQPAARQRMSDAERKIRIEKAMKGTATPEELLSLGNVNRETGEYWPWVTAASQTVKQAPAAPAPAPASVAAPAPAATQGKPATNLDFDEDDLQDMIATLPALKTAANSGDQKAAQALAVRQQQIAAIKKKLGVAEGANKSIYDESLNRIKKLSGLK